MLVRGVGIRDISAILKISVTKVLKVLNSWNLYGTAEEKAL
jgi:hypothetical protein